MKTKQIPFPGDSLAAKYLPADYADAFECACPLPPTVTPDDILQGFSTMTPGWVEALMKLRNALVRPFGLKYGNDKEASKSVLGQMTDRSENETVSSMDDKHLLFYVSVRLVRETPETARVTMGTIVHLHNRLGKVYFTVIRPFHKIIVQSSLKRVLRKLQQPGLTP